VEFSFGLGESLLDGGFLGGYRRSDAVELL